MVLAIIASFTIKLEAKDAQRNETFRVWHNIERRNTTSVKNNGSKTNSSFEKVGNVTSKSKIEHNCGI